MYYIVIYLFSPPRRDDKEVVSQRVGTVITVKPVPFRNNALPTAHMGIREG